MGLPTKLDWFLVQRNRERVQLAKLPQQSKWMPFRKALCRAPKSNGGQRFRQPPLSLAIPASPQGGAVFTGRRRPWSVLRLRLRPSRVARPKHCCLDRIPGESLGDIAIPPASLSRFPSPWKASGSAGLLRKVGAAFGFRLCLTLLPSVRPCLPLRRLSILSDLGRLPLPAVPWSFFRFRSIRSRAQMESVTASRVAQRKSACG